MASKEVVETIYGRYSKYEITETSSFTGTSFYIYKDGKPYRGSFSTLAAAVEAARSEG